MTIDEASTIPGDVLLVEDSQADAYLIDRELSAAWPGIRVVCVRSRADLAVALAGRRWDVVLSDYELPGFSGPAALALCLEAAPDTPFLVVSGKIGEEAAVAMMKAGASDYIVKDRLSMLVPAIEREIREARRRLEHRQLEKQFLRAQRLESIGMMASGIAHDLNNIFLPIKMVVGLLRKRLDDEEGRRYLALLEDSTEKGTALTRQMLSFVRGEKGGVESAPVDVAGMLEETCRMVRTSFPKKITILEQVPEGLWPVSGNVTQLQQVLLNLCLNARDAMPDGGTLRISGANARLDGIGAESPAGGEAGERHVVISVKDSGTGIPDGLREKIFDAFFTTKDLGVGTGLGLSTVQKIVNEHEGFVTVRSTCGEGSEFSVHIPACGCAVSRPDAAEAALPAEARTEETILVVDDEQAIILLVKGVLESHGYRVLSATNGAEALHRFGEHHEAISAVLLDFVMPVFDGPETVRAIRRISRDVPIVYISGSDPELIDLQEGEVQGVLAKPFSMEALLSAVREAIDLSR
jgi:signal transduction histidine kinase